MTAIVKNRENELRSSYESANRIALDKKSYGEDQVNSGNTRIVKDQSIMKDDK